jgi:hypothetical protein
MTAPAKVLELIDLFHKAPDYCFRIGGARKFFLEAKKPAVNLKDDPAPAYQLRRYAWSAKLPLSILTSFAELAVYDCRIKPAQTDKASAGRLLYVTSTDVAARWDELAGIFSREAVLKGSFDKYADAPKGKSDVFGGSYFGGLKRNASGRGDRKKISRVLRHAHRRDRLGLVLVRGVNRARPTAAPVSCRDRASRRRW